MALVLRNGRIYTPVGPDVTVMVVESGVVTWLGTEDGARAHLGGSDTVVDLGGALVTPAFVDAHVHCTATGLALGGLELSGAGSAADILDAVATWARAPDRSVLLGSGWDDAGWRDRRRPTAGELSRASGGRAVYLARVDVHSALVSSELLDPDLQALTGYAADGWLRRDAHDAARTRALARLTSGDRDAAQAATLHRAASLGVAAVHEMAGPSISGAEDLRQLLTRAADPDWYGPEVVGYWAELGGAEAGLDGVGVAAELGAVGAGGDLFCDGALGSHTAALHAPYADAPDQRPPARLSAAQIGAHIAACTEAGLQAGFHAIGDAAVDTVLDGVDIAIGRLDAARVRSGGHRLEHAEMVADPGRLAASGLLVSMQPAFDAAWGGATGMYAERLGPERAAGLNDFAALSAAGVPLAFGSDAPVTALDPWGTVRAAAHHHRAASSISVRAAFAAHTRGGWRAAGQDGDGSGILAVGHPATYAVWSGGHSERLTVDPPDERVSRWSTDPGVTRAGLPDLASATDRPICRQTVVRGRVIYDAHR